MRTIQFSRPERDLTKTSYQLGFIDGFYGNEKNPGHHTDGGRAYNAYEHGDPRRVEYNEGYHHGRAVNSHDELVAALTSALGYLGHSHGLKDGECHRCKADAALAKAEPPFVRCPNCLNNDTNDHQYHCPKR